MRYLIIFLFSISTFGQVTGAVGNGIADDTAALQAWLDSGANLTADAGATYRITSQLDIDQVANQTINWNNSTIITNNALAYMVDVDKRNVNGGVTTMSNLTIDANEVASRGMLAESNVNINNITVFSMRQPSAQSPAGIQIRVRDDSDSNGDTVIENFEVFDLVPDSDGSLTNSLGASNAIIIEMWTTNIASGSVTLRNGSIHDGWGDDAGGLFIQDLVSGVGDANPNFILIENVEIYDIERRTVKGFSGGVTYKDCTFTDPDPNNPNIVYGFNSGLFVTSGGSPSTIMSNVLVENCTFNSTGYDGRVIVADGDGVKFQNCTWNTGTALNFISTVGDVDICGAIFNNAGISSYGTNVDIGNIRFDTDNVYNNTTIGNIAYGYTIVDLECPPLSGPTPTCNDGIQNGTETGIDCGGSCAPCSPDPDPTPQPNRIKALRRLTHLLING